LFVISADIGSLIVMNQSWDLKILYDGACPLCSAEMDFLRRKDKSGRIAFEDISKSDFDASKYEKTIKELNHFIHAILPSGELVTGVEVFRRAYSFIGLGYLIWITRLPIIKQGLDLAYRIFAKNRISISKVFGRTATHSCDL
jgi:predicted DCC family thiol-disulfide oxidoreductase YuxK